MTTDAPPLPHRPSNLNASGESLASFASRKLPYGLAIFTSAFLLFEIEPIIAKIILPWFGGVAAVWAVCLVFFQITLLLGYSYAHLLTRKVKPRAQGWIHAALLIASLFVLRVVPRDAWKPSGPEHPTPRILLLLLATVGLPYFLLSTSSPLLQSWYATACAGAEPYRFYALSNAGSMLALISYPILVEPHLSTSHQALGWSIAYGGVVLLCVAIALLPRTTSVAPASAASVAAPDHPATAPVERRPPASLQALWVALAACSSALLLAVTNHISQNIASVPFLWILPLTLYLLSFILCFDTRGWYRRDLFLRLLGIAIGGMTYALGPSYAGLPWKVLILLFCLGLFVCCMFCHGELARLKPAAQHLTLFYLMVALGGAIGAIFVALVTPQVFSAYYELHVAIGLCAILVLVVQYRDPSAILRRLTPPGRSAGYHIERGHVQEWNVSWVVLVALVLAVIISLAATAREQTAGARLTVRNFYGVLRVIDGAESNVVLVQGNHAQPLDQDPHYRKLMNGTIDHGLQFLAPSRRSEPTTYYGAKSGVGIALRAAGNERPLRVGAIGLGVGTVATYGREGDRYTFYEINPLVVKLGKEQFTFLRDSPAAIEIILGDARLSLEGETARSGGDQSTNENLKFDILIVDAFSGDSIPVHLLTREAFELYFSRLKSDGVLAVHISNQYLDLQPVVTAGVQRLGKEAVIVNRDVNNSKGVYPATWILAGNRSGFLGQSDIEKAGQILPPLGPDANPWTDDYSSLWRVLK